MKAGYRLQFNAAKTNLDVLKFSKIDSYSLEYLLEV